MIFSGITLSIAVFAFSAIWVDAQERTKLEEYASNYIFVTQQKINNNIEALRNTRSLYAASREVERHEFHKFALGILSRHADLQALEWVLRVTNSQRTIIEAKARQDGLRGFQIRERNAEGRLVRAKQRNEYFPVYFLEPLAGNEAAVGFDLASNPVRRRALEWARDSGEAVSTARIQLIQGLAEQYGYATFLPVYRNDEVVNTISQRRRHLLGFVLAVYRIGHVIENNAPALEAQSNSFDVYLYDDNARGETRFLYATLAAHHTAAPVTEDQLRTRVHEVKKLQLSGRTWLAYFVPRSRLTPAWFASVKWGLLAAGLFLTGILAMFLRNTLRQADELARSYAVLYSTQQKLSLHVKQTPLGVIEWNTDFEVVEWNPAAEKIFGFTREEALGRHAVGLIVAESNRDRINKVWQSLLENTGGRRSANESITKEGHTIKIEWYNTPLVTDDGKVIGVASLVDDITDRTRAEAEVQHMAFHDALTGLVNRGEFEVRLNDLLIDARNHKSIHALLYIDLDQFKIINDTCGHAAGDAMLKALTEVLQHQVRKSDILARLGGDEFGILLTSCPVSQAKRIADTVIQAIKKFHFDWKGVGFELGASIGMVSITDQSEDISKVMSAADMACYMAKDMGRGRVHTYSEDDSELARRHGEMEWVSRISQAMKDDRFILYQQDIIALNSDRSHLNHKELLLRLTDRDGRLVAPDEFIPPAERYNLMPSLDRWVIKKSFTEIAKNSSGNCQYSINLSGTSLNDDDLIDYVKTQFAETGLVPSRICFEITETAAISNLSRVSDLIQKLRAMGCLFSLDDFGKGASSFTYLKNLSVDYLKIDGSFVVGFTDDPTDLAIIESINNIGHALGIQTIAEWVEDAASLKKLEKIGVDFAQGYVIGKPEPFQAA